MQRLCAVGLGLVAGMLAGCGGGAGPKVFLAATHEARASVPPEIKTLAVTQFTGQSGDSKIYAQTASEVLANKLAAAGKYKVVERMNLAGVLKEQDLADAGITDRATARKAGQLLNADGLIFGAVQVTKAEDRVSKTKFNPLSRNVDTV